MAGLFDQLRGMSRLARLTLFAAIAFLIIGTISAFLWVSNDTYRTLFTDLEPRDSAAVIEQLEQMKVEYQLAHEGRQILIPESRVHEIRMKLMGTGVPLGGGVGFEIFDSSDFGMTEFAQRINYQRALEGELTRTIMSLNEVKYARVHLVLPEKGLFKQKDLEPSASVTLFLKNEFLDQSQMSHERIVGIQRLVSASVPQLLPEHVTVSDQAGNTLSQQIESEQENAAVSSKLRLKQSIEEYLTEKINKVLSRTFGKDVAIATVDVDINFDEVRRTLENVVTPEGADAGVLKSRENRSWSGGKSADGGVVKEVEYKLGRTVEQVVESPGKIQRLNVSVVVPEGTDEQRVKQIRDLVEKAVGLNAQRGDAIAIQSVSLTQKEVAPIDTGVILPESTRMPEPKVNQEADVVSFLMSKPEFMAIAVGFAFLILTLLIVLVQGRSRVVAPAPGLSNQEREEALRKLNSWLETAPALESTQRTSDGSL